MAEANRTKYLRNALLVAGIVAQTGTLSAQEAVKHLNPVIEKLAAGKPFIGFQTGDLSLQNARTLARADIDYVYLEMEHGPMDFAGLHQFTLNCAGCHQSVARGGLTLGAVVPNLDHATPQQIAEAVRMGPYLMPHFDAAQINQHDLDSIAAYVLWTRHPDNAGGWGIYNIGPIPEGMVAWFIGLAAMVLVARLIGERLA